MRTTLAEQDKPQQLAQRLKLVDPETASKPIADAFALLPVINVFRAMANAETLYPYFSDYMLRLFRPLELDKALERMIVLHVASQSHCFYAWRQNVVVAHTVGVNDEQIAALEKGDISKLFHRGGTGRIRFYRRSGATDRGDRPNLRRSEKALFGPGPDRNPVRDPVRICSSRG